jgi:adenylyltransferase/sulfurtransferase
LNNEQELNERYSRFISLPIIQKEGMAKIRKAKATIVGLGGLGAVTATQLTSMGIGKLRIIDNDVVTKSNLQRQLLYRTKDIGKAKVIVAKKFLEKLNPETEIEAIKTFISEENISVVSKNVDFIIDAVDKFTPRFLMNTEALEKNLYYLFAAANGFAGNVMTINRGATCLECLFSHVKDTKLPTTQETGIHPSILQIIGSLQVAEATRIMVGLKPLLVDNLIFCDIGTMEFEKLPVKPNKKCRNSTYH